MEVKEGPCLCGQPERMGEDAEGKPVLIRCPLYMPLWVNKENGEKVQEWKCAIAWMPILMIENAGEVKAVAGYMESFRNEVAKRVGHRAPPMIIQEVQDAPSAQ